MSQPELKDNDTRIADGELIAAPAPQTLTLFQDKREPFVTNFKGDKIQTWKFMSMCKGGAAKSLQEETGKEIDLKYYFCHPVEIKGATAGEIMPAIRTVLVTPNNELYETVSDGVAAFVQDLIRFFGDGVIDPPQRVRIVRKQTRSKFHTMLIEPVL